MKTFTFDTTAAYLAAKASSGAIYTELVSSTEMSRSCVSYIKDIGKSVIDAVNVVVDEPYGSIGDILIYKGGSYYWLKSMLGYQSTSIGGCYGYTSEVVSKGYSVIGALVHREGQNGLICALEDINGEWCTDITYVITNVTTASSIRVNNSVDRTAFTNDLRGSGSREWAEYKYDDTYYQYTHPFPRTEWDKMINNVRSNTTASGASSTSGQWSWTTTATSNETGLATASFSYSTSTDINPKDYHYSFDEWYDAKVLAQYPTTVGALSDMNGIANTKAMLASGYSCPIAAAANNYAPSMIPLGGSVPTDFAAGKWWLPSAGEMVEMMRHGLRLLGKGVSFRENKNHWTSTQCNNTLAWVVGFDLASVYRIGKTTSSYGFAFSAYHFLNN